MTQLIAVLQRNWTILISAPWAFLACLISALAVAWAGVRWEYARRLAVLGDRLKQEKEVTARLSPVDVNNQQRALDDMWERKLKIVTFELAQTKETELAALRLEKMLSEEAFASASAHRAASDEKSNENMRLEITRRDARIEALRDQLAALDRFEAHGHQMARALVRAADERARKKPPQPSNSTTRSYLLMSSQDHREALSRYSRATDGSEGVVEVRFYDPGTGVLVRGEQWRDAVLALGGFVVVPPSTDKDYASEAIRGWTTDYVSYYNNTAKRGGGWSTHWTTAGKGASLSMSIQDGPHVMARLDVLATIEDYAPVLMAQCYSGTPADVEERSHRWLAANQS
jgi:hypothetical protein